MYNYINYDIFLIIISIPMGKTNASWLLLCNAMDSTAASKNIQGFDWSDAMVWKQPAKQIIRGFVVLCVSKRRHNHTAIR